MTKEIIKVENVSKAFDGIKILDNVSFCINSGECVALCGKSGTGKTTLMRIVAGLETADSGTVKIADGARMTYVFQENRLFENLTALENILCVAPDKKRAEYFLKRCHLQNDMHKKAGLFSGGMKRRLAVARALSFGGDIYFFDEPLRELDTENLDDITQLIKEEIGEKTALLITHDEKYLEFLADRCITV